MVVCCIAVHFATHYAVADACIAFRYTVNLADGNEFVYKLGERVPGISTPLFTLLSGPLSSDSTSPALTSACPFSSPVLSGWFGFQFAPNGYATFVPFTWFFETDAAYIPFVEQSLLCAFRGEENEMFVDPTEGDRQEFVRDRAVCYSPDIINAHSNCGANEHQPDVP